MDELQDYYAVLGVEPGASAETIRRAFRARLLEAHPDKTTRPTDPDQLRIVIESFDVLGQPASRERYDRVYELAHRSRERDEEGQIPHVTQSDRPVNRARAILFLLLNGKSEEAVTRLDDLESLGVPYLSNYLEDGEFVDAAFLLAEHFERKGDLVRALSWLQELLRHEEGKRQHRPCYPEAIERAKRLLIHRMSAGCEPRVRLEYLRRAEGLGLSRAEEAEVEKRRAGCFLEMEMKHEAARRLRRALELQPQLKGVRKLTEALAGYL